VSETLDQILEALPVFPLSTVLFPGEVLPLHIFEERYKQMVRHALEHGVLFGLSYKPNAAVDLESPPEVGSVGCVARINAVMPLEDGRMNIVSTGIVRYRVVSLSQHRPFIIARVESMTDDMEPPDEFKPLMDDVAEAARKFFETAKALDELGPLPDELPDDAEALSLLVASALPVESRDKQLLLEMTSTRLRLSRLRNHLAAAIAAFGERLQAKERARRNGHGKLKHANPN
jgi:Lon protease-like protein